MAITHRLDFISSGHEPVYIDEPTGFDGADFGIEQGDNRIGRDVIYAGKESRLTFEKLPEHALETLLYNFEQYGNEAVIRYTIQFNGSDSFTGELSDMETDGETYLSATITEISAKALFKNRYDVGTDIRATEDLNGNPATPPNFVNVLIPSKPIYQVSKWINPTNGKQTFHDNPSANADYVNIIKAQTQYDIRASLSWLYDNNTDDDGGFENFVYIEAATNLQNVKVAFDLDMIYDYLPQSGLDESGQILLRVYYGQSTSDYTQINVWDSTAFTQETAQQQILPTYLEANIPLLNQTDKLWISWVSATNNGAINRITWNESSVTITATSVGSDVVVPMYRLIDIMKYNCELTSALNVSAPRWDIGGEFYDTFVTTQALMRRLYDKPFIVSTKDIIEDYMPVVRGDYQIQGDSTVFYGRGEVDFYRDYEIAAFPMLANRGFKKVFSPRYTINKFNLAFKNFASQRSDTTENTYDLVHGELHALLPNQKGVNSKDVSIGWIFDSFLWRIAIDRVLNLADSTATSDDDKKYVADVVAITTPERTKTKTATLKHEYDPDTNILMLTNQQDFSWVALGITINTVFQITGGANIDTGYEVAEVTDTTISLIAPDPATDSPTSNTTFKYYISPNVTNLVARTNQGFSNISGLSEGDNYMNLRYTSKRVTENYYGSYLASACLNSDGIIRITDYRNNPDATTQYLGESEPITEGENFNGSNPVVTPLLITAPLEMTLQEFLDMSELIQTERGFVRTWDSKGLPVKLYPKDTIWKPVTLGYDSDELRGECEMIGEEKYEPFLMEIFSADGLTTINNVIILTGWHFSIDNNGYLSIFDLNGMLMYSPVPYDRVRVNNSDQFETTTELGLALNALI